MQATKSSGSQRRSVGLQGSGLRIAVVVSRFNPFVTERLLEGALGALRRCGVAESDLRVARVPGAFEIPTAAQALARRGGLDAIVCLGAVIRGETPHFEYISSSVASGISRVSLDHGLPVGFGILTVDNERQAEQRSGPDSGNKGAEAALSVVEMAILLRELARGKSGAA